MTNLTEPSKETVDGNTDPTATAQALIRQGELRLDAGDIDEAIDHFEDALPHLILAGDRATEGTIRFNIGEAYWAVGMPQDALDCFREALPIQRELGDRKAEAATLHEMADVLHAMGDTDAALRQHQNALSIQQQIGDTGGEAATRTRIGEIYEQLGDRPVALTHYERALELHRAGDDPELLGVTLYNLSFLVEVKRALALVKEARDVLREAGSPYARSAGKRLFLLRVWHDARWVFGGWRQGDPSQ
jgi:tetratricopeptide (TPR) repeat protein